MKIKNKVAGSGLALIMALSFATGASASTKTNNVEITVQPGEMSLAVPTIETFGNIILDATPKTYNSSFNSKFTIKDLRGSQAGWRLDLTASQFDNGGHKLPIGSFSIDPPADLVRVGTGLGAMPTISKSTNLVIDDGTIEVAKAIAGSGMGVFDLTLPQDALSLVVDATTAKAGKYESVLTWDLVLAP